MALQLIRRPVMCILILLGGVHWLQAQQSVPTKRCGSAEVLEAQLQHNPALRQRFEQQAEQLRQTIQQRKSVPNTRIMADTVYVPIVFHIVMTNPNLVTDAQIMAQIDTLNKDYAGKNGDSIKILDGFKPRYGHSLIQFRIAQRTPTDDPATGITRTVTSQSSYTINDARVKYTAQGGHDIWDRSRYLNVWITNIAQNYLGYATFPQGASATEDGVVIQYTSLPGGAAPYDRGRTLTHEAGHYFSLLHIWGNDSGCGGGDEIGDTPNQAGETGGCPVGIRTDVCSGAPLGIMYQNYMDYTNDACMVMFTNDQVDRMHTAIDLYRSSLFTSNGHLPVGTLALDASAKSINFPLQRACAPTFSPVITLRNRGIEKLTAVDIHASLDDAASSVTHWTGSLNSLAETSVTLNSLTTTTGSHTLKIFVSAPNGGTDLDHTNDTLTMTVLYQEPLSAPLTQGFTSTGFPPAGWDILNPDLGLTWQRASAGKSDAGSAVMLNFNYNSNGQKDYLRLPLMNIANVDSAFLTFQVAAAVSTNPNTAGNEFDTLEVMASTDCGLTYTSLYRKWGSNLITRSAAVSQSFVPGANDWRKDSVNLSPYIGVGPVLLAFVNTTEFENNIYLDDINLYSVAINPNLKKNGFLVTPNPTLPDGRIAVQFFPNPANLRSIAIYSSTGQKVAERVINGAGATLYNFDLSRYAAGVYVVQVVFDDRKITQKVIKR